jgi:hypothetical protein
MAKKTDGTTGEIKPGSDQVDDGGNTDWQAAYKGLQTKLNAANALNQTLRDERDEAITNLTTTKTDLATATDSVAQLTTKVSGFESQVTELEGKAAKSDGALERSKLIIDEYSDLAKFESKGLLPDAETPEELKEKLATFRETLGSNVQDQVDKTLDGSTPPLETETTDDDLTEDQLRDKMMAAAGVDDVEYARLQKIADARE